jgi:nucleoside-diphosphate-sugar epimerase
MTESDTILVIGASGQIGTELILRLRQMYGADKVIATDIRLPQNPEILEGPFEHLNVTDYNELERIVVEHQVGCIYHLAAMLSATGEKNPDKAWDLNMNGLLNVLRICKNNTDIRLFWPSSIAVFGPRTPKDNTPQYTVTEPSTVYGISKIAGEYWCQYYHDNFGVDVRSIRYPGIIGHKSEPGGGTTDYAVHIFYDAIEKQSYECFLSEERVLPMMFMEDAIDATIEITEAPSDQIKIRTGYNLAGFSFSPKDLAAEIQKSIPEFSISYNPDFRDKLAASWPSSIDDSDARADWNWNNQTSFEDMVAIMLREIGKKKEGIETF